MDSASATQVASAGEPERAWVAASAARVSRSTPARIRRAVAALGELRRLGRDLSQAGRECPERAGEVAAVDRRHKARCERRQGQRLVPIQEMAGVFFEAIERVEHVADAGGQAALVDEAEVARGEGGEEAHRDVGGRGAMGDPGVGDLLVIVRRQPMVFGPGKALEVAPKSCAPGAGKPGARHRSTPSDATRPAGSANTRWPARQATPRGRGTPSAPPPAATIGKTSARPSAIAGAGHIWRAKAWMPPFHSNFAARAAAVAAVSHSRSRRWVTTETHERQHDGVDHLVGVESEEE